MKRAALASAVLVVLAACGGDDDGSTDPIRVENAVVGEAPAGADAAVYFDIVGGEGDALVGASTSGAAGSSLHDFEPVEGGGVMLPTDRIEFDDGVTSFRPVGSHVMLEELSEDLVAGDSVQIVLSFDDADDLPVQASVVPLADLAELLPD